MCWSWAAARRDCARRKSSPRRAGGTILADHKASVGRKFLVAGRGGLNLTHSEPVENFPARYADTTGRWTQLLADFSPDDLRGWAKGLGIETFVGTSGRIFPATKQAAPLLRRWIARLRQQGVSFRARHELAGFQRAGNGRWIVTLTTPAGAKEIEARAVIFGLGGASWPQTGSDGVWVKLFTEAGIASHRSRAANCGYEVDWPATFLAEAEGLPLKNVVVHAGGESVARRIARHEVRPRRRRDLSVRPHAARHEAARNRDRPQARIYRGSFEN